MPRPAQEAVGGVCGGQRSLQALGEADPEDRERLVEPFPHTGGRTRMVRVQASGEVLSQPASGLDVAVRVGAGEDRLHPRPVRLRQIHQDIALRVDLTPLEHRGSAEGLGDGRVQGLRAIEDHQHAAGQALVAAAP